MSDHAVLDHRLWKEAFSRDHNFFLRNLQDEDLFFATARKVYSHYVSKQ